MPTILFGEQFFHGDLGSIGGYPAFGAGVRYHNKFLGADLSAKTLPGAAYAAQGVALLYPFQGGLYAGAGYGYLKDVEGLPKGGDSVNAVLGFQRKDKWFIQLESATLLKRPEAITRTTPSITIGLGF